MMLHELLTDLPMRGVLPPENPVVTGVCHDSRRVEKGDLFVAIVGESHDGRRFLPQAMERGAVAALGPGAPPEGLRGPWIEVADPRRSLGPLAARAYGHPDRRLTLAAITGTNGKSTVTRLLASMLRSAERPCGEIGTLGYRFGELSFAGERTTPEASDLFHMLRDMESAGAKAAVMEASSQAVVHGRLDGALFDVAVFTNLTRDHLDLHGDMESYFAAKRGLFSMLKEGGRSVVGVDDAWGRRLSEELPGALTFGAGGDVRVREAALDLDGIRATLELPDGPLEIHTRLLGRFNLQNLLAAVATAVALELPRRAITEALALQGPLPGRLEPVPGPLPAFVDFAHTPGALEAALGSLRELSNRRIVLVFGCGGGKDQGKRPVMGRVAGELADHVVLTSDNPRFESPEEILEQAAAGLEESGGPWSSVVDRSEAIRLAVSLAAAEKEPSGALVLVAGKGHEEEQVIGDRSQPFSDQAEIRAAFTDLGERSHG